MPAVITNKTNFSAGELDPNIFGRLDLSAYTNGAKSLHNVFVKRTGGVSRRPGTEYIALVDKARRIMPIRSGNEEILLVLLPYKAVVLKDKTFIATIIDCPWEELSISTLSWTQYRDTLLICHKNWSPRRIFRDSSGNWRCEEWIFADRQDEEGNNYTTKPFAKFWDDQVSVNARAGGIASNLPIPPGTTVTVTADAPVFNTFSPGTIIRIAGKQVRVSTLLTSSSCVGFTLQKLFDGESTKAFEVEAFSDDRGWPHSLALHQGRLVIGGSRDLPDMLWLSKVGSLFDFDLGTGLDDESLAIQLLSNSSAEIRYVLSGRHLQVFTESSEWIISGRPITPKEFETSIQTNIGSYANYNINPINIDGATVFIGRNGNELREFLFANSEQAYQAPDLAVMSRHLLTNPVAMTYDSRRQLFLIALESGHVAAVAMDRIANIVAWSEYSLSGQCLDIASGAIDTYALVHRAGSTAVVRFDEALQTDFSRSIGPARAGDIISGLEFLDNDKIFLINELGKYKIQKIINGKLNIKEKYKNIIIGLPFDHKIIPMPFIDQNTSFLKNHSRYRPIQLSFLLHNTYHLNADVNQKNCPPYQTDFDEAYTGVVRHRAFGWRDSQDSSSWKIVQNHPTSFNLLSVTLEAKVGR